MENQADTPVEGRVTRGLRKRLMSTDVEGSSRPVTPLLETSKQNVVTPRRSARRNSLSTPSKTPVRTRAPAVRSVTPDIGSPPRRVTRSHTSSDDVSSLPTTKVMRRPQFDTLPEEGTNTKSDDSESPVQATLRSGRSGRRITRSQSKSPTDLKTTDPSVVNIEDSVIDGLQHMNGHGGDGEAIDKSAVGIHNMASNDKDDDNLKTSIDTDLPDSGSANKSQKLNDSEKDRATITEIVVLDSLSQSQLDNLIESKKDSPEKDHSANSKSVAFSDTSRSEMKKTVYPKTPLLAKSRRYFDVNTSGEVESESLENNHKDDAEVQSQMDSRDSPNSKSAITPYKVKKIDFIKKVQSSTPKQALEEHEMEELSENELAVSLNESKNEDKSILGISKSKKKSNSFHQNNTSGARDSEAALGSENLKAETQVKVIEEKNILDTSKSKKKSNSFKQNNDSDAEDGKESAKSEHFKAETPVKEGQNALDISKTKKKSMSFKEDNISDAEDKEVALKHNDHETKTGGTVKESPYASSWSQGVSSKAGIDCKIDAIKNDSIGMSKSNQPQINHSEVSLKRRSRYESDDEEETEQLSILDDQAVDAGSDYRSGDSMDSEERREILENEIESVGESLGSTDTDEEGNEEEEDKNSFVVSDDNASLLSCEDEGSDDGSKSPTEKLRSMEDIIESTSEEEIEALALSPGKTSNESDAKSRETSKFANVSLKRNSLNSSALKEEVSKVNSKTSPKKRESVAPSTMERDSPNSTASSSTDTGLSSHKLNQSHLKLHYNSGDESANSEPEKPNATPEEIASESNRLNRRSVSLHDNNLDLNVEYISIKKKSNSLDRNLSLPLPKPKLSSSRKLKTRISLNKAIDTSSESENDPDTDERPLDFVSQSVKFQRMRVYESSDSESESEPDKTATIKISPKKNGVSDINKVKVKQIPKQSTKILNTSKSVPLAQTVQSDSESDEDSEPNPSVSVLATMGMDTPPLKDESDVESVDVNLDEEHEKNDVESAGSSPQMSSDEEMLKNLASTETLVQRKFGSKRQTFSAASDEICKELTGGRRSIGMPYPNHDPSQSFLECIAERKRELQMEKRKRKRLSESIISTCSDGDDAKTHLSKRFKVTEVVEDDIPAPGNTPRVNDSVPRAMGKDTQKKKTLQNVLERCNEILEAANQAKLKAKVAIKKDNKEKKKGKERVHQKKEALLQALKASSEILQKQSSGMKIGRMASAPVSTSTDQTAAEQSQLSDEPIHEDLNDSAEIPPKQPRKKRANVANLENETLKSKRLPEDFLDKICSTKYESKKKTMEGTYSNIDSAPQEFESMAGTILETTATPKKPKRVKKIKLATGTVSVEPATPKNKNSDFLESPITPKGGYKVSNLLTAGQDKPPAMPEKKHKSRKRKRDVEEPTHCMPQPHWTSSGVFLEEDLPPSKRAVRVQYPTATRFIVKTVGNVSASAPRPEALSFKTEAMSQKHIPREKTNEVLNRKQRLLVRNKF